MPSILKTDQQPTTKNLILILGGVIIVGVIVSSLFWLLKTEYGLLFSELAPQDAAKVIAELENQKVPYRISQNGTALLIPQDKVHETRLKLAGANVTFGGGVGLELFDKSDFGMTEFVQKINYQRAMQGELARTISSIEEIRHARVHLMIPQTKLFSKKKTESSASVTVFLKSGSRLAERQIIGIQKLVANAVDHMSEHNVVVIDQDGNTISNNIETDQAVVNISSRLKRKQELENYLTRKIEKVLEQSLGPNQSVVGVNVNLDYRQTKTTREDYIPVDSKNRGVIRRKEIKRSDNNNSENAEPQSITEIEYQFGKKVDLIISEPGSIKNISIGVSVPEDTSSRQIKKIQELVAMAAGLDDARGDKVVVHAIEYGFFTDHDDQLEVPVAIAEPVPPQPLVQNTLSQPIQPVDADASDSWLLEQIKARVQHYWTTSRNQIVAVFAGLFFLVLIIILLAFKLINQRKRLSESERNKLLLQINHWLEADENGVLREAR
ncbi:MAG: flagellar basal-body MS-ring/collar protein FliF [Gammaproteobacteria bacterium]|nr:flagellar basal-body MS-ring/collar protein FliF [Gammaproteobacteria bacterium]MDH5730100.1 flagellar basal-body MS-ring/collar protein FliF [Gammaproteobacteria bacterium]